MPNKGFTGASRLAAMALAGASLAACASIQPKYAARAPSSGLGPVASGPTSYKVGKPYQVGGIWYVPREQPDYNEVGVASWYGEAFNMKATADGEIFDMNRFSAAHTTLPLPSIVEVTNLENGRRLQVRVNDRGPFVDDRIIDLSRAAAEELGYRRQGLARVRVRYIGPAPLAGPEAGMRYARASPAPAPAPAPAPPSAPTELASSAPYQGASTRGGPAPGPLAPAEPIEVATLAPPAPASSTSASSTQFAPLTGAALGPLRGAPAVASTAPAGRIYRIQAGAFSDQGNARRAAAQLAGTGTAVIEPIQRGGTTLYRVMLPGPDDVVEAYALRDRVASIGFTDARVMQPF